ncbi:MAG: DUF1810 domain-containing protein [Proteobacteria bacterium]|nr:DUF1810 domain-containing protein [Pseudomonadota bacterium]
MADPFNLQRFVEAQDAVYPAVLSELKSGHKTSHWMWFVFPQLQGLGRSSTARFFALAGRAEAAAYLAHPILGQRLIECTLILGGLPGRDAHAVFGSPDDLKFHSSMTLFAAIAPEKSPFAAALAKYFAGKLDDATLTLLGPA